MLQLIQTSQVRTVLTQKYSPNLIRPCFSRSVLKNNKKKFICCGNIEELNNNKIENTEQQEEKKSNSSKSESQGLPQIFIWVVALLAIIGTFYTVVFYAGAGFFYLMKDQITFTKKDFIPYSERLEMEKKQQQEFREQQQGGNVQNALDSQDQDLLQLLPSSAKE